ncbi:DUF6311 domain-containing protein [Marinobacterium stanieri]|uniref:DUF6311 domain-containing protein n=1 Tax=Marinobacterium stanieri TaxID=49186 RepID=UPI003A8DE2B5
MKGFITAPAFLQVLAGIALLVFSIAVYNPIIHPLNVNWIYHEGDIFQHYVGWDFFKRESWQFPLGKIENLATDMGASVVFTDSIPLVALLLKPFNTLLPDSFQYIGIWTVATFFLNGYFATRLLHSIGVDKIFSVLVAMMMCTSTLITARGVGMHGHEALMAHWLIFFAIELSLSQKEINRKSCVFWTALLSLSVLIHFYLFFMVGVIWFFWFLIYFIYAEESFMEKIKGSFVFFLIPVLVVLFLMILAGYFIPGRLSAPAGGFGHFSAELLTFFNPGSTAWFFNSDFSSASTVFPGWFPPISGQYEGMSYVGLGVMLLWFIAILSSYVFIKQKKLKVTPGVCALAIASIGLFIYALAGRLSLPGSTTYLYFDMPFSAFKDYLRSSGRMVWPLAYSLIVLAALTVSSKLSRKVLYPVGLLLISIQVYDLYPWHERLVSLLQSREGYRVNESRYHYVNYDDHFLQEADVKRKLIAFPAKDLQALKPFIWLASSNNMSINVAYLAGQNSDTAKIATQFYVDAGINNELPQNAIYLITSPDLSSIVCARKGWICKQHESAIVAWWKEN